MAGYVSLVVFKDRLGLTTQQNDDAMMEMIIIAASRAIDRLCKRPDNGFVGTADAVRVYDVQGEAQPYFLGWQLGRRDAPSRQMPPAPVEIGHWAAVTAVKTDDDGDGAYETTWAATDYELLPPNAAAEGRPYTAMAVRRGGTKSLPAGHATLQITGTYGEVASPDTPPAPIREATILLTNRLYSRRKAAFGRVNAVQERGGSVAIEPVDPDIRILLYEAGYIEHTLFA